MSETKSKVEEQPEVIEEDEENAKAKQNSNDEITESEESAPYAPSDHNKDSESWYVKLFKK